MRIGSLCTGYGGLDMGVSALFPASEVEFVSDVDRWVNELLDVRYPDVPNVGNFTELDALPEVDALVAGFPCQPVSVAGKRKGQDDDRWLWPHIERLLGVGRPPAWVFLENVPGLRTANGGEAFREVVGGLAALGYVGRWRRLTAAAVGACHKRDRLWVVATHADRQFGDRTGHAWDGGGEFADGDRPDVRLMPTPTARDHKDGKPNPNVPLNSLLGREIWKLLPTPHDVVYFDAFGEYAGAVKRHADVTGTMPPHPTDDQGRLAPKFVEWMMMLPEGWVTDLGFSRTQQLRMLGNGVVPLQAEAAYRSLMQ